MNTNPSPVSLSKIDEERFGVRVAKAPEVTQDTFSFNGTEWIPINGYNPLFQTRFVGSSCSPSA
jgi:hypothetical protein